MWLIHLGFWLVCWLTKLSTDPYPKRVLNFVKHMFFLLSTEGSLVDIRAYLALHLGGTPSQEIGTSPLAVNSSTTVYI